MIDEGEAPAKGPSKHLHSAVICGIWADETVHSGRMFATTALAVTALAALLVPSPAHADAPQDARDGWRDNPGWAAATVSPDRRRIGVCDKSDDGRTARVEYTTSDLRTWTVTDANGARPGCAAAATMRSRIDSFRLCPGGPVEPCRHSVWVGGSVFDFMSRALLNQRSAARSDDGPR